MADTGDLIDPADIDWTQEDDGTVWRAAQAGIPQAVAEADRRNGRSAEIHQSVAAFRAKRRGH